MKGDAQSAAAPLEEPEPEGEGAVDGDDGTGGDEVMGLKLGPGRKLTLLLPDPDTLLGRPLSELVMIELTVEGADEVAEPVNETLEVADVTETGPDPEWETDELALVGMGDDTLDDGGKELIVLSIESGRCDSGGGVV
ncbi:hypothetical protein EVG20_g8262 [Dentipellis fragilis]|uniref:Uncharacterized protein n=1 Tax=Dentipellis fragilis TaxID=205917 RepID=A0A4Y9Y7V8_9AGAM|nr:hypothetical protein EVG20_g8262 [Dentipellis fragilis]